MADQTPGGDSRPEVPRQRNPEFSDYPRPRKAPDQAPPKPVKKAPAAKKTPAAKKAAPAKKATPAKKTAEEAAERPAPAKQAAKQPATKKPAKKTAEQAVKPAKKAVKAAPSARAPEEPAGPLVAAPPAEGTPAPPAPPAPAVPAVAPGAWPAALWEALQQPDEPPRRLAELAVAELGPRAAAWAAWLRETYPEAPAAGFARLAAVRAARAGWGLAALDGGGPLVVPFHLSAAAWVRATLVLRIAAVHGHDPRDSRRADELLALLRFGEGRPDGVAGAPGAGLPTGRLALALHVAGRFRFRRRRQRWHALAINVVLVASDQVDQLTRLAHRADRYYRSRQPADLISK